MDTLKPLATFRVLSAGLHGLTGAAAVAVALVHLLSVFRGMAGPGLASPGWSAVIRVTIGVLVLAPAVLVTISCVPMMNGGHRSFRSGAAAGFVLGVSLLGIELLFDGALVWPLLGLLAFDLVVVGLFATTRRRLRQRGVT